MELRQYLDSMSGDITELMKDLGFYWFNMPNNVPHKVKKKNKETIGIYSGILVEETAASVMTTYIEFIFLF